MEPKIIIDTGTWIKFDELIEEEIISLEFIKNLTLVADVYITHEIEIELRYFEIKSYSSIKHKIFVVPIINKELFEKSIEDGYDIADSSIIGIQNIENYIIISEDRPLVEYYSMFKLNIMFFADFIWILLKNGMVSKNSAYKIIKPLQKLRNLPFKKYHRLIGNIQKF